jgi:hypothetical protein
MLLTKFAVTRHDTRGKCPPTGAIVALPLAPVAYDVSDADGPLATLDPAPLDANVSAALPDSMIEELSAFPDTDETSDRFYQRALDAAKKVQVPSGDYARVTGRIRGALLVRLAVWRSFNAKPPTELLESIGELPANLLLAPGSAYQALVESEESAAQAVKANAVAKVKPADPIETRKLAPGRYVFQARNGVVLPDELQAFAGPTYVHALTGDKSFPLPEIPGLGWTQRVGNRDWVVLGPGDEWTAPASIHNLPAPALNGPWWQRRQQWGEQYHAAANTPQRGPRPAATLEYAELGEKWIREHGPRLLLPQGFDHEQALTCQVLINGYLLPLEWTVEALWAEMQRQHAVNVERIERNYQTGRPKVWYSSAGTGQPTTPPEHPHNGWNEANIADLCTTFYVSTSPCHMPYGAMIPVGWVEAAADRIKRLAAPWLRKIIASRPAELSSDDLAPTLAEKIGANAKDPLLARAIKATLAESGYEKKRVATEGGGRELMFVPTVKPADAALAEAARRYANAEWLIDHNGQGRPPGFGSNP